MAQSSPRVCNCGAWFSSEVSFHAHVANSETGICQLSLELETCRTHSIREIGHRMGEISPTIAFSVGHEKPFDRCDEGVSYDEVLLRYFVQQLSCAETCVFCFERFQNAKSFIDHAENRHWEAQDPIKSAYMNAIRKRLLSQAATLLEKARFGIPNLTAEPLEFEGFNSFDVPNLSLPVFNVNALDSTQLVAESPFMLGVPSTVMTMDDQFSGQVEGTVLSNMIAPIEIPVQNHQLIEAEPPLAWDSVETYDLSNLAVQNNTTPMSLENSLVLSTSLSNTNLTDIDQLREATEYYTSSNMLSECGDVGRAEQPLGEPDPSTVVQITQHRSGIDFSDWFSNESGVNKRRAATNSAALQPCVRCRLKKKKCENQNNQAQACKLCTMTSFTSLCVYGDLISHRVFEKWDDQSYKRQACWPGVATRGGSWINIDLFHFIGGPSLNVMARVFTPDCEEQTKVWEKTEHGWKSTSTPAVMLGDVSTAELKKYIQQCREQAVSEYNDQLLQDLWHLKGGKTPFLLDAFDIWTANRLLVKGWRSNTICTNSITNSPYIVTSPAPRVLQNQLDRELEDIIVAKEKSLLGRLGPQLKSRSGDYQDIIMSVILLLRVIERDIWRLMYWVRHETSSYKWRHPRNPRELIANSVFFSQMLLAHVVDNTKQAPAPVVLASASVKPVIYNEKHEQSIDGSLVKYLFNNGEGLSTTSIMELIPLRSSATLDVFDDE